MNMKSRFCIAIIIVMMLSITAYTPWNVKADGPLIRGAVDIIIVLDTTGSMGSYIAAVKSYTSYFANELQKRGYDFRLGLIDYKDKWVDGPAVWYGFTSSVDTFTSWVSRLNATGGGDAPESGIDAMMLAENKFKTEGRVNAGKMIIVVTDAPFIEPENGRSAEDQGKSLGASNIVTNIIGNDGSQANRLLKHTRGKFYNLKSYGIKNAYDDILNQIGLNRSPVILNVSYTPNNPFINNPVTLSGFAEDPDGDPLVYTWTARKANGLNVTLGQGSSLTFTPDLAGNWDITLTVHDPFGALASRTITIAVGAYDLSAVLVPEQVTRGQRVKVIASLTVPGTSQRTTADHIYLVLPNGQQIGMNWDAVLSRYWAEFLVPETGWARDGTHTLRVVAVKYGVEKSVTLSFVVRGNIKEKLYIRQIIF